VFVDSHSTDQLAHVANAAQARGVELRVIEFGRPPYDYAGGFQSGRRAGAGLFIGLSSPVFAENREVLSGEIVRFRMPAIVPSFLAGRPGSLISYTSNPAKIVRRAAELGVKILQGAKPADVPVEAVAEFELTVNLRTAKMLGLNVPYSVLARATKVIE
jgi:putative ABC transport system substrate-binding protein